MSESNRKQVLFYRLAVEKNEKRVSKQGKDKLNSVFWAGALHSRLISLSATCLDLEMVSLAALKKIAAWDW